MSSHSLPSPTWNARAVSDTELEQLFHPQAGDGLVGSPADADLVYADNSGMNVKIRANRLAIVRGRLYDSGTSDITKTITANASGLTRVDLVVLRLTRATSAITEEVRAGAPGAGAPTATTDLGTTGVYEIPLATITVPSGDTAIGSSQVTALAWYLGEQPIVCTSATRPPHSPGQRIVETDTGRSYESIGSTWRVAYEDTGLVSLPAATGWTSNGTRTAYQRRNGITYLTVDNTRSGTAVSGAPSVMGVLPAGFRPTTDRYFAVFTSAGAAAARVLTDGSVRLEFFAPISSGDGVLGSISFPS